MLNPEKLHMIVSAEVIEMRSNIGETSAVAPQFCFSQKKKNFFFLFLFLLSFRRRTACSCGAEFRRRRCLRAMWWSLSTPTRWPLSCWWKTWTEPSKAHSFPPSASASSPRKTATPISPSSSKSREHRSWPLFRTFQSSFCLRRWGKETFGWMDLLISSYLSFKQTALLVEPNPPDPSVHILLPPLKALKPLVERLKKLDEVFQDMFGICIWLLNWEKKKKDFACWVQYGRCIAAWSANRFGSSDDNYFWTRASKGIIDEILFRYLVPFDYSDSKVDGADAAPPRDPELWGQARVDMKKFSKFLVKKTDTGSKFWISLL